MNITFQQNNLSNSTNTCDPVHRGDWHWWLRNLG